MRTFYATHIDEWHDWLAENHQKENEIWFVFYKQKTNELTLTYQESLAEAICFGWIDGLIKKLDKKRYVRRFSPRKAKSIWSQTNKILAQRLMQEGRLTPYGMNKIEEAKQNGNWDRAYDMNQKPVINKDIELALRLIPIAWENFTAMTNSYQSRYIYWINSAKREATRKSRITKLVELARQNI